MSDPTHDAEHVAGSSDVTDPADQTVDQIGDQGAGAAPSAPRTWTLAQYPEQVSVVRLGPGAELPGWAESSSVFSITATAAETSVVCASRSVPRKARQQGPFTAFEVAGPLDFALTGVLAELLAPLAEAGIGVFTLSTFDTDWLLVPRERADDAAEAWRRRGHAVAPAVPV